MIKREVDFQLAFNLFYNFNIKIWLHNNEPDVSKNAYEQFEIKIR